MRTISAVLEYGDLASNRRELEALWSWWAPRVQCTISAPVLTHDINDVSIFELLRSINMVWRRHANRCVLCAAWQCLTSFHTLASSSLFVTESSSDNNISSLTHSSTFYFPTFVGSSQENDIFSSTHSSTLYFPIVAGSS